MKDFKMVLLEENENEWIPIRYGIRFTPGSKADVIDLLEALKELRPRIEMALDAEGILYTLSTRILGETFENRYFLQVKCPRIFEERAKSIVRLEAKKLNFDVAELT